MGTITPNGRMKSSRSRQRDEFACEDGPAMVGTTPGSFHAGVGTGILRAVRRKIALDNTVAQAYKAA